MFDSPERTLLEVARREWLRSVSAFTRAWRHDRAAYMVARRPDSLWHQRRARGLRERESRAAQCGVHGVETSCASCGEVAPSVRRRTCSDWRLCYPCRARRSKRAVARFHTGRARVLERLAPRMERGQYGGIWRECFYTLTVPRLGFDADWGAIREAWPRFRRALRHYLRARGCPDVDVPFCRSVEVTSSKGGHWHVHVWSVLPYIPQWVLAHLWGKSLPSSHRAACPRLPAEEVVTVPGTRDAWALAYCLAGKESLLAPVVDVRSASEAAAEIAKYMVKDIERGALVSPVWFASVYRALEGARSHEFSRKWTPKRAAVVDGWHPLLLAVSTRRTDPWCTCGACLPNSRSVPYAFVAEVPLGRPPS